MQIIFYGLLILLRLFLYFDIKPFLENNGDILKDYKYEKNKESKFPFIY